MNIKALITTLILGSSSAAMAKPVVTFSAGASVSVGVNANVRDHHMVRGRHIEPDCGAPAPAPAPVYQPVRPLPEPRGPWFNPSNTTIGSSGSSYVGTLGHAPRARLHRDYSFARRQSWFMLTEGTRIDNGREFFNIKGQSGSFSQLMLKNLGGRTEITQVAIEYIQNGRSYTQKVKLGSTLSGSMALTIDLDRDSRSINRIIVYGASGRGSAYQFLAM